MKLILTIFAISAVIIGSAALMAGMQLSPDNEIILHFDTAGLPDFTGSQRDVLLILATGGGMVLVNFFLARVFERREHFTGVVVSSFTLFLSVLLFIATSVIIANNK
jgi:hypothetical protein